MFVQAFSGAANGFQHSFTNFALGRLSLLFMQEMLPNALVLELPVLGH